jgi:hypothetical protein
MRKPPERTGANPPKTAPTLPPKRARRVFTSETGLAAGGIALAGAAGLFAYTMVERGERQLSWAPISPFITPISMARHPRPRHEIAEPDPDSLITGSIAPDASGRSGGGASGSLAPAPGDGGYTIVGVEGDVALLEGPEGFLGARRGTVLPRLGAVLSIERQDGAWVVVTANAVLREHGG